MAKLAANKTRVWFDITDVSGFASAWTQNVNQEVIPVAGLSTTGPERVVGNYDHNASITAFGDYGDDTLDEILTAAMDDDDHYLLILTGTAEGSLAYEHIAKVENDPQAGAVGGATTMSFAVQGTGGFTRGALLRTATITGDGDGTGQNLGTTSSGDVFQVVYRVLSGTFTSFTLECHQSSDNGSGDAYAEIADLNSGTISAAGVVRKTTTGATEAWKRITVDDWNGTDAVILVTVGQVAGT